MMRPMSKCRNILAVLLTTFLTLMPSLALHAQTMTVTGVVKDSNDIPLAGVSVFVVGTNTGVVTGYDGDYKINVAKGKTLRFSFIGFETQDIKVDKSRILGVSFSGQMHGLVALDKDMNVIRPSILWCDQRTQKQCDWITE